MTVWAVALLLAVAGSVGGLLTASLLLFVRPATRERVVPWLVSYAVGTLLGAALLALTPQALESLPPTPVFSTLLAGILTFFVLEKLVLWRHSHDDHHHGHAVDHSTATLVIVGDTVHAFVDGVVIAAAVLVSVPLGLTTALAIAAHEIPQEAGDFGILLAAGYSRSRALVLNLASAGGGVLGALVMLAFGERAPEILPYVLSFAAGNLLYVAMSDLIPALHQGSLDRNAVRQLLLIGLGILTIAVL